MTTTDHAAEIRATLKAKGITSRQVSVRADYYSMGSSIRVVIKDASISAEFVKTVAEAHERVDRDQWGEILCGGNRFVDVTYDHLTLKAMSARFLPAVAAALVVLAESSENSLIPVEGTYYLVGGRFGRYSLWIHGLGHQCECWDADGLAQSIAIKEGK